MTFTIKNYYNNSNTSCYFKYPFESVDSMIKPLKNRSIMIYTHNNKDNSYIAQRHNIPKNSCVEYHSFLKTKNPYSIHMAEFNDLENDKTPNYPIVYKTVQEIKFDIDASDYDNNGEFGLFFNKPPNFTRRYTSIRTCNCINNNTICKDCWYLIGSAVVTIQYLLEKMFGISKTHLLWVYSGNRGIHCWVNNKANASGFSNELFHKLMLKLMTLTKDEDILIVMNKNNNNTFKDLFNSKLYPYFMKYIVNTNLFTKLIPLILEFINCYYNNIYVVLEKKWKNEEVTNNDKWNYFIELSTNKLIKDWNNYKFEINTLPHEFIVMRLLLPVYDKKITIKGHNLKLPFSIHHSTKRLSFPMDFDKIPDVIIDESFINKITLDRHECSFKTPCCIKNIMEEGIKLLN